MPSLELKNISKTYSEDRSSQVLEDFNLGVNESEFLVLVGPSGSGKSTIIRIIAGLEEHQSGQIVLDGESLEKLPPKDRKLSMVFQNYALYPHKTVYENIAFPLKILNLSKSEINSKVHAIAEKLNIDEYLDRKPKELSGGQRQRVALARAMVRDPKLFLMDEPLSNLDAKLRAQMRTEISNLHRESGKIFIYVTHDQIEALTLGDRIVVLDQGEIQQIDSPHEIYNNPQNTFVASFIGSPPCNLLEVPGEKFSHRSEKIILGIRPEFLHLANSDKKLSSSNSDSQASIRVKIQNIELIGNEYLLYVSPQDPDISIYLEPGMNRESGFIVAKISENLEIQELYKNFHDPRKGSNPEECNLYFDISQAYFFDKFTKKRI